jgi:predicted GTPase
VPEDLVVWLGHAVKKQKNPMPISKSYRLKIYMQKPGQLLFCSCCSLLLTIYRRYLINQQVKHAAALLEKIEDFTKDKSNYL